jgi:alpha-tubulin suppressor-like RCC1 family protein
VVKSLAQVLEAALISVLVGSCAGNGTADDAGTDSEADGAVDSGSDASADADTDTDTGYGESAIWMTTGGRHTCALVDGGFLKCWGDWHFGQLGYGAVLDDDPSADVSLPSTLPFVDVGASVVLVDGGGLHTCAVLIDGNVKCWGYDGFGQLGVTVPPENGDTLGLIDVPADYSALYLGGSVIDVSAGGSHTCALLDGGDMKCWGDGEFGQLGYGSTGSVGDPSAIAAVELGDAAAQVSSGARHTCAVLSGGDVYCWGDGQYGALGYGNTEDVGDDELPGDVGPLDVGGPAVLVSCGYYHTCALLEIGEVLCWGLGDYGALGFGNTDTIGDDETPASVGPVDVGGTVVQVSVGAFNTCALIEGGGVKCWGSGGGVPLGYGNTDSVGITNVPADVGTIDLGGPAVLVDNGYSHVCALRETGEIFCWGAADNDLGYGATDDIGDDETPADVGPVQLF